MRRGIAGFILGVILTFAAGAFLQRVVTEEVADDLSYRFAPYVFHGTIFPFGYLDQGQLVHRLLFPVRVATRFFDASYNEVTQADKPGRYGAVVKLQVNTVTVYRFITLYRTPVEVFWSDGPMTVTTQLPPNTGVDPAVANAQQGEIGQAIKNGFAGQGDATPDLAILLAGLAETSPTDPAAVDRNDVYARDDAWWFGLRNRLGLEQSYPRLVDLPAGYDADPAKRWPLILSLHGSDGGASLEKVRNEDVAGLIHGGKQIPAIVVSPQCKPSESWSIPVLNQLLDEMCAKYRVDPDRIYLTGASAGGDIVWLLAETEPDRFAALAPIAGEGDWAEAARIKDIPTWTFEGQNDEGVPPAQVIGMVAALRQAGGHPHFTLYPDTGHDSWDKAYATDALFTWMLAQKRGQPEVVVPGVPTE